VPVSGPQPGLPLGMGVGLRVRVVCCGKSQIAKREPIPIIRADLPLSARCRYPRHPATPPTRCTPITTLRPPPSVASGFVRFDIATGVTGGLAFLSATSIEAFDIPVVAGEVDVDELLRMTRRTHTL
jgi:hypothetical protein